MRPIIFLLSLFLSILAYSQEKSKEDLQYELIHKSQPWFANMRDGANYFEVKNDFETYFGERQWETSKPRALGESWLKSKLFYLDEKGIVQNMQFADVILYPIIVKYFVIFHILYVYVNLLIFFGTIFYRIHFHSFYLVHRILYVCREYVYFQPSVKGIHLTHLHSLFSMPLQCLLDLDSF